MNAPLQKLGLSASQFGLDQPAGPRGRSPQAEAKEILSLAARARLGVLDVGHVFAHSEQTLGDLMPRPQPFRLCITAGRADRGPEFVEAEARASLRRLGVERAYAIIVDAPSDLFTPQGAAAWRRLQTLRDQGLFERLGISAHATDDPVGLARHFHPDLIQAPASLLDQRLLADGSLAKIAAMNIEVHLRSIFLNGLLFLPPDRASASLHGQAVSKLSRVRRMIAEGRSDPLQAALGFALSRNEGASVLVGVTSAAELSAVIAAAASPPPDLDWDDMAIDDPAVLDPRRWAAA
jgi:aryl-alcohol dehydrogenase-like predicted oxidoreductase